MAEKERGWRVWDVRDGKEDLRMWSQVVLFSLRTKTSIQIEYGFRIEISNLSTI